MTVRGRAESLAGDRGLRYPGIKKVERVFFYGADVSTPEQLAAWPGQAFRLGRDFKSWRAPGNTGA